MMMMIGTNDGQGIRNDLLLCVWPVGRTDTQPPPPLTTEAAVQKIISQEDLVGGGASLSLSFPLHANYQVRAPGSHWPQRGRKWGYSSFRLWRWIVKISCVFFWWISLWKFETFSFFLSLQRETVKKRELCRKKMDWRRLTKETRRGWALVCCIFRPDAELLFHRSHPTGW